MATEGHQPWSLASSATMAVLARTDGGTGCEGQGISVRGSVLYFTGHLLWSREGCRGGWRRLVYTSRSKVRRRLSGRRHWAFSILGDWVAQQSQQCLCLAHYVRGR